MEALEAVFGSNLYAVFADGEVRGEARFPQVTANDRIGGATTGR
jgi:hypothetical protein